MTQAEFVDALSQLPQFAHVSLTDLMLLHHRIDANSALKLTWDDFLSYLVKECALQYENKASRGAYKLSEHRLAHQVAMCMPPFPLSSALHARREYSLCVCVSMFGPTSVLKEQYSLRLLPAKMFSHYCLSVLFS
jgi:hypothetical protein